MKEPSLFDRAIYALYGYALPPHPLEVERDIDRPLAALDEAELARFEAEAAPK